jgi:hypothetical protein
MGFLGILELAISIIKLLANSGIHVGHGEIIAAIKKAREARKAKVGGYTVEDVFNDVMEIFPTSPTTVPVLNNIPPK